MEIFLNPRVVLCVVAALWGAQIILSVGLCSGLPKKARFPMGWRLTGAPSWTAPAIVAASLYPTLALIGLAALIWPLSFWHWPTLSPEYAVLLLSAALLSTGGHGLHLFLARRYVRRQTGLAAALSK